MAGFRLQIAQITTLGLYQGTASQAAEKLASMKGTAFRPYITVV